MKSIYEILNEYLNEVYKKNWLNEIDWFSTNDNEVYVTSYYYFKLTGNELTGMNLKTNTPIHWKVKVDNDFKLVDYFDKTIIKRVAKALNENVSVTKEIFTWNKLMNFNNLHINDNNEFEAELEYSIGAITFRYEDNEWYLDNHIYNTKGNNDIFVKNKHKVAPILVFQEFMLMNYQEYIKNLTFKG